MALEFIHVPGKSKAKIKLFALSTCGWCRKTKGFLNDLGAEYDYIDVDSLAGAEREAAVEEIKRWNPQCSFPTIVINDDSCIVGFEEEKIRRVVK